MHLFCTVDGEDRDVSVEGDYEDECSPRFDSDDSDWEEDEEEEGGRHSGPGGEGGAGARSHSTKVRCIVVNMFSVR